MLKPRLSQPLLFSLIIAFLAMQWTTTHIHLAQHHDHNGKHHHHHAKVHAHKSIDNSISDIDFSLHSDGKNIVELDYEFSASKIVKLEKSPLSVLLSWVPSLSIYPPTTYEFQEDSETKLSYYYHLTANPRAPPVFS